MAKFKIVLHKDGTQVVEPLDAVGESCMELTAEYEKRSGVVVDRKLKPAFYETELVEVVETVTEAER